MRTTVDLPPALHRRVKELAGRRGASVSATIADLTARGLAQVQSAPMALGVDEATGFPVISVGRPITDDEVRDFLAESE